MAGGGRHRTLRWREMYGTEIVRFSEFSVEQMLGLAVLDHVKALVPAVLALREAVMAAGAPEELAVSVPRAPTLRFCAAIFVEALLPVVQ